MPEPRWRCWLVANNKKEVAFNHYPQKSPNESAVELLNFVDIEKYYPVCDMPFYRLEGAEEEHF
jgi:hypothetical protein